MQNNVNRGLTKHAMKSLIKSACVDRLEEFRSYTDELDSTFKGDKQAIVETFDIPHEEYGIDGKDYDDIMEFLSEDVARIEYVFVATFRSSTVVSLYSCLEKQMHVLCKRLEKTNKFPISVTDLKGDGVVRSKIYLSKMAGISFDSNGMNGHWSNIIKLNKVRNQIVHE